MDVRTIEQPAEEPVTLAQARRWLRIDVPGFSGDTSQDEDILSIIRGARQHVEDESDRSIGLQTIMLSLSSFHQDCWSSLPSWRPIRLPRGPVRSVESITYRDSNGDDALVGSDVYRLTADGLLYLRSGQSWPAAIYEPEAVRITYRAGYDTGVAGSTSDDGWAEDWAEDWADEGLSSMYAMPEALRHAMRLLIAHFWVNRGAVVVGPAAQELPLGVSALIFPNRVSFGI